RSATNGADYTEGENYQTNPSARRARSKFAEKYETNLRSLCLLLFKIRNYQTKPMLDAPNIYLRNPRHPRLKPGPGFLPNEPSQLSRRFHARRTEVRAPMEICETKPFSPLCPGCLRGLSKI